MMLVGVTVLGDSGREYDIKVDATTRAATCTCPAYRYDGAPIRVCKHIAYVASALAGDDDD